MGPAQHRLELAEGLLNRREIRRIRRQEDYLTARSGDQLLRRHALVDAEVVPDDGLPRRQRGNQHVFDEDLTGVAGHGPLHRHRRRDAIAAHGRNQGGVGAMIARRRADHPLATWGAPVAWRHGEVRAALIDEDQGGGIAPGEFLPPGGAHALIALRGEQDFL